MPKRLALIYWLRATAALVFDNPIIARELKVRVRFARAFWLQGAYLLFLIVIVSLAYQGIIAKEPLSNPAELQDRLQEFYRTFLYSLIGIVTLITPALTAGAISFERERQTLDLLLATPLSPSRILLGKMIASFAYLMLLLTLSMPIVTVCILFGGATVPDLLATFAMIAFTTLYLSAFALYCSACNRSSGAATFWAYLGSMLVLVPTLFAVLQDDILFVSPGSSSGSSHIVAFPLLSLHPIAAVQVKTIAMYLFGVKFPCWLFCAAFSLLLTRFWLTGAGARLVPGGNATGLLRRQALLLSVLIILSLDALLRTKLTSVGAGSPGAEELTMALLFLSALMTAGITLFIPWIATFGEHQGNPPANDGSFCARRMFRPVASGALPFLLVWFGISAVSLTLLLICRVGAYPLWTPFFVSFAYYTLALTFFWQIGRFWSSLTNHLNQARILTVATIVLLLALPGASKVSLVYPVTMWFDTGNPTARVVRDMAWEWDMALHTVWHTGVLCLLTIVLFFVSHNLYQKRHAR